MLFLPLILFFFFLFLFLTFLVAYFLHFFIKKPLNNLSYAYRLNEIKEKKSDLDNVLDKIILENSYPNGKNLLSLISNNIDAFAGRVSATALAGRSLDLMYYIWEDDFTGRFLLSELLKAADRGVRVRLLLDDINVFGRDPIYAALDQHTNIEIRVFNPSIVRFGKFRRIIEIIFRAFRVTRRMHNKAYIVDGRLAFVGGRNIGDSYFDISRESNFRDLDLLLIGEGVRRVEEIFDQFWNSAIVQPINFFSPYSKLKDLMQWRQKLKKFNEQKNIVYKNLDDYSHFFFRIKSSLFVTDKIEILSDPPEKALKICMHEWIIDKIFKKLEIAKEKIQITSPYFIPGKDGINFLKSMIDKNVDISILTNSLAATDVAIVHGGYISYRKKLLKNGIKIFELKDDCGANSFFRFFNLKKAKLHTKAFIIDQKYGFIGSFNFDPRSASLNTEMGIFFESEALAARMDLIFCEEITQEMSYRLEIDNQDRITWHWIHHNVLHQSKSEPKCNFLQKCFLKIISWLPIESQL